jgi:predicted permease
MNWHPFFRREFADSEQQRELESHLEMAAEDFAARGMNPSEARRAARIKLGNSTLIQEEIHIMNTPKLIDTCVRHARHTLRTFQRNPTFAGAAILTMTLAIGANTAVFTVVNSVLLRPLPYPHPDELVDIHQVAPGAPGVASLTGGLNLSASLYFTYSEQSRAFQKLGVWFPGTAAVTGAAEPEQVHTVLVSDGTLDALNVPPVLGRSLSAADQMLSSPETVMLGYGYWQKHFGGGRSVIGRTLSVDSRPRVIVGVMPAGFRIADTPADLILPFRFDRSRLMLAGFAFPGIGRLKSGVSIARANADLSRLIPVWMSSWPSLVGAKSGDPVATKVYSAWRITPALRPLRDSIVGDVGTILWVVMGTLGIVMLIAGANVANLLLVRAAARQQELGVRAALGAGWGRNARELLMESMLLACAGGALGTGLAYAGLRLLVRFGPSNLPRLSETSLDPRALAFSVAVALLSGLLLGLIAALKYATAGNPAALRGEGRASTGGREHNRMRNLLVVAQVALALVLLIGSSLMVRTFNALHHVDPGFAGAAQLQTFRVAIPQALVASPEMVTRTQNAVVEKLRAIPGVTSAAFASAVPMDGSPPNWDGIFKEGQDYVSGQPMVMRLFVNASPGFFLTTGTRLVAGRDFTWGDLFGMRSYVLISENLAREWFGSASGAVGKRIRGSPIFPWREVIGVVEHVRSSGVHQPPPEAVYEPVMDKLPWAKNAVAATRSAAFVVRSNRAGTAGLLAEVQRAVWSVNAALPLAETQTMQTIYDCSMARTSFTLVMLAVAGGMALVLGIVGIYGVIAYAVSRRSREIGIRSALGARPGELKGMFVRNALALAGVGIALGLSAAVGLTRLMKALLFGISPLDPVTYAVVPVVLISAAALASYLPARRAAMVDPVDTLRAE